MNALVASIVSVAMLAVYGALLRRRIGGPLPEFIAAIAFFVVAVAAAAASFAAIVQFGDIDLRRALGGIAYGALLAAGVVMLLGSDRERPE